MYDAGKMIAAAKSCESKLADIDPDSSLLQSIRDALAQALPDWEGLLKQIRAATEDEQHACRELTSAITGVTGGPYAPGDRFKM